MNTHRSTNLNFKRLAATLLSLIAILAIAFPAAGGASAQADPAQFSLKIRAYIDGYSRLVIQGDHVYWHHIVAAAPGRLDFVNEPTWLNGTEWYPTWPDIPDAENRDCDCVSSTFTGLDPALPENLRATLRVIQARDAVFISQQPYAGNANTLIVDFNDWPSAGADWYEVDVVLDTYDIYVVNVRNGIVEQLTTLEGTGEYNPSWSPDGKKIVHDVVGVDFHALYITDVRTHASNPLPGAEGGNDAAWSPNGKWIVFDRRWYADPNLYLLPPAGGTPRLVVSNAVNGDWSPDSQRLVFERDGGLWTASVKGGGEKQLVEAGSAPVWSPDGRWIAYDLHGDIWKARVTAAGARLGDPIQLTSGPDSEGGPTWSPDGRRIAFASDASGDYDIWQMNTNGSAPVRLVRTSEFGDYDPDYARNGQYIAYDGAKMPAQPYIAAFPKMNYVEAQDWPKGDVVHLMINDPHTKVKPDYEAELPTLATSWGNWWAQFYFDYDLQVGDKVTETDGYITRTYTVRKLDVTEVNTNTNTAAGIADPGAMVYLWLWDHDASYMELKAKRNGTWLADFDNVGFQLAAGICGRAEVRDALGNRTAVDWCVPNPRFDVFPAWNYVQGWDWQEGAMVTATTAGKPACSGSGLSSKLGSDTNTSFELHFPPECSLADGDNVMVTDGLTTHSLILQKLDVTSVDASADTVAGIADPGVQVQVSGYVPGYPTLFVIADGSGAWLADFKTLGVDLVTGNSGTTRIFNDQGCATGMDWSVP